MAAIKVLARGWTVEIDDPDNPGNYSEINGLTSLTFDTEKKDANTTSFDDVGFETHVVASRNKKLGLEGFYLEDQSTLARDDGQQLVEELSEFMDAASIGTFRITSPAGRTRTFRASAAVSGVGGGNDDPTGWKADLAGSGENAIDAIVASAGISALVVRNAADDGDATAANYLPTWAIGTYIYAVTFTTETSFRVKPTAASHTIKIYVDGTYLESVSSGVSSSAISLAADASKKVVIKVNEDDKSTLTYDIMVARIS